MEQLFDKAIIGGEKHALAFVSNLLQASSEYAIIGLDLSGEILLWNVGASKLYGFEPHEMLGKKPLDSLLTDKNKLKLFPMIKKAALKDGKWKGNVECQGKDGRKFTALFTVTVHVDTGTPIGLVLMVNDITKQLNYDRLQKLNIERLEKEKYYNRNIIDSIETAIIITDIKGNIIDFNSEAEKLTGYAQEELINSPFNGYFLDHKTAMENISRVMAGEKIISQKLMVRTKDGRNLLVSFSAAKIYDQLGNEQGVFTAENDVTEREAFDLAMRDKTTALENAIRAKDKFLASMSHELRTPLNSIIGFTDILLMKINGELSLEQEDHLKIISKNAKFLLSIINDLLDIAKIQSGKLELKREKISCQNIINEVSALFSPLIQAKKLDFEVKMPSEKMFIDSNRRAFKQIIINITNNAVKYTQKGKITIQLRQDKVATGSEVIVSILDTGCGIAQEDQAGLFKPFRKINQEMNTQQDGAGLGLYLCKELAALIGCQIKLESVPGKGSLFSIHTPLYAEAKTRVLVIEDNPSNLKLMLSLLNYYGYEVLSASGGAEGLALALEKSPDLILCDIQLPMMSGYELVKELKSHAKFKKIPIIAVSAYAMLDDRDKALASGFDGFITKPIDTTTFHLQISDILSKEVNGQPVTL